MKIIEYLKNIANLGISNFLRSIEKEITIRIIKKIRHFERYFIKSLIAVSVILTGIIFVSISATFLLIEYLKFTKTLSFAIIGFILILIGIIVKLIK
ncbi:MAG: hypothetical protein QXW97_02340 [Candidatus Pacearchaeota archaeon]